MKTRKLNHSKILRKTSLFILTIMISSGVFAQNSLKLFELKQYTADLFQSSGEIISAMNSAKEKKAFYEEEILLEEWMINLEHWAQKVDSSDHQKSEKSKSSGEENTKEEVIIEEELELESWMTDHDNWIQKENFFEEELTLENWMQYPKMWNVYACN